MIIHVLINVSELTIQPQLSALIQAIYQLKYAPLFHIGLRELS